MVSCDARLNQPSKLQLRVDPTAKADSSLVQEADLLHGLRLHDISIHLAFLFTWLACLVSFYLSLRHATNYTRPNEQKQLVFVPSPSAADVDCPCSILRILFMVPVFSVTAFLSIKFYELHVYLETAHQFYEAIVLAAFFLLLCHFLAPDLNTFKDTFTHVKPKPWIPRPKCLKKRRAAIEWNGPPKPATSWSKYINVRLHLPSSALLRLKPAACVPIHLPVHICETDCIHHHAGHRSCRSFLC